MGIFQTRFITMASAISVAPAPPIPEVSRVKQIVAEETAAVVRIQKIAQCAMIIAALGITIALSAAGVLPLTILTVAKISVIALGIKVVIAGVVSAYQKKEDEKESAYEKRIKEMHPIAPAVLIPIVEEGIFRGILQGGLYWVLARIVPLATVTLLGIQFSAAALASILIAGSIFGIIHATNGHDLANVQAFVAALSGVFVLGPLYHFYGLWASILDHIMTNTLATTMCHCKKPKPQPQLIKV
jgi:membrane protease YdiL (CAAX protease family)